MGWGCGEKQVVSFEDNPGAHSFYNALNLWAIQLSLFSLLRDNGRRMGIGEKKIILKTGLNIPFNNSGILRQYFRMGKAELTRGTGRKKWAPQNIY